MENPNFVAPRTVEEIYTDFYHRYSALRDALTTECFILQDMCKCKPEEKNQKKEEENEKDMCLYGLSNGKWEVGPPPDHVPTEFPQPVLGINFINTDINQIEDWLRFLARHSDSWLLSLAFFFAAWARLTRPDKERLFDLINIHETLTEVVDPPKSYVSFK